MKSNKVMGNCYSLNTSQNECNTPQIKIKVEKKVGSSHSQYARHSQYPGIVNAQHAGAANGHPQARFPIKSLQNIASIA